MKQALSIITAVFLTTLVANAEDFDRNATDRRVRIAAEVIQSRQESLFPISENAQKAARCVGSLKVVKAGFIWGGEGSTGLISCRVGNEWSAPSFFNTGGVSFGFQIGVQFIESVMLFITPHSQDIVEHGSFQVGVDLSVAAGPVGGGASGGVLPNAAILTYDRSVGLFAGASINGFVIEPGVERNHEIYGEEATAASILSTPASHAPSRVDPFLVALHTYIK